MVQMHSLLNLHNGAIGTMMAGVTIKLLEHYSLMTSQITLLNGETLMMMAGVTIKHMGHHK